MIDIGVVLRSKTTIGPGRREWDLRALDLRDEQLSFYARAIDGVERLRKDMATERKK